MEPLCVSVLMTFAPWASIAYAQWAVVENRPLRGGGQPAIRRMRNATEAWETTQKSVGWEVLLAQSVSVV